MRADELGSGTISTVKDSRRTLMVSIGPSTRNVIAEPDEIVRVARSAKSGRSLLTPGEVKILMSLIKTEKVSVSTTGSSSVPVNITS